jgi:hypothetical protein
MLWSISFPGDQHYKSTAFENGKQVFAKAYALINLYVFSTAAGYIMVLDNPAGPAAPSAANPGTIYPVTAGGYISIATHGGDQMKSGLYVGLYSTAALAAAGAAPDGGNVMWIKADWRRGNLPNAVTADPAGYK